MGTISDNPNNWYDESSHRWRSRNAKQGAPVGPEARDRAKAMSAAMSQLEEDHDPLAEIGEVRVRDGDEVEAFGLTFFVGEYDDAVEAFSSGGCLVFALVAKQESEWPIYAIGAESCQHDCEPSPEGWCPCVTDHFLVRSPDSGDFTDINGNHSPRAIQSALDGRVLRPATDADIAGAMRSWGASPELVGWARHEYRILGEQAMWGSDDSYDDAEGGYNPASDPLDVEGWQWLGQSKYTLAVFDGTNIEGQCEGVNGQWAAHLILRDENTHVDLADYISEGNADVPAGYAHTVALVDGEVWDWSYRQIDPDGPVPLRMPVDEWESTWGTPRRQHLSRDDAEEILADDW